MLLATCPAFNIKENNSNSNNINIYEAKCQSQDSKLLLLHLLVNLVGYYFLLNEYKTTSRNSSTEVLIDNMRAHQQYHENEKKKAEEEKAQIARSKLFASCDHIFLWFLQ